MGEFKFLQYQRTGDLVRIAINRPPFNVLDIATMTEMHVALDRALAEPGAKAVLLTGVGEKAFSAGDQVTPRKLDDLGYRLTKRRGYKILGSGVLSKALTVHAHAFSRTAALAITKAGGSTVHLKQA